MTARSDDGVPDSEWRAAHREFLDDDRERVADDRERIADERERIADERERIADERELELTERLGESDEARSWAQALDGDRRLRQLARAARDTAAAARRDADGRRERDRAARLVEHPTALARLFSEIAGELFAVDERAVVLERVTAAASELVPGCSDASVTVYDGAVPRTVCTSSEAAVVGDEAQYAAGQGPCLDATGGFSVYTPDMWHDDRWPRLRARSPAVTTAASFGLGRAVGGAAPVRASLNLYSRAADGIDEGARELATVLAAHAALALEVEGERRRFALTDQRLRDALLSRDLIGQAKGILMERDHLTADQAFDVLRRASQALNVKLRDLADRLARTGELPLP